jgi:hypothetical protein
VRGWEDLVRRLELGEAATTALIHLPKVVRDAAQVLGISGPTVRSADLEEHIVWTRLVEAWLEREGRGQVRHVLTEHVGHALFRFATPRISDREADALRRELEARMGLARRAEEEPRAAEREAAERAEREAAERAHRSARHGAARRKKGA